MEYLDLFMRAGFANFIFLIFVAILDLYVFRDYLEKQHAIKMEIYSFFSMIWLVTSIVIFLMTVGK